MRGSLSRRSLLGGAVGVGSAALADGARRTVTNERMTVTLNSSTIRPVPLEEKARIAASAGYDGLEPWIDELESWDRAGRSLEDLGKQVADLGLIVPNVIGLWDAMPADEAAWPANLDLQKRRMELARRFGAQRIATIPTPDREGIDVLWAAERYRRILTEADRIGIEAAIEFVGFFQGIHTLGQAVAIALESGHPKACIVADTFHLFRGGSGFEGVRKLQGSLLGVCHVNDALASPSRAEQGDGDRVYPGDGVLPLARFFRDLWGIGFRGPLSLELFREEHWRGDPLTVARTGRDKLDAVLAEAGLR